MRLHKLISNSKDVIQSIPPDDRTKGLKYIDLRQDLYFQWRECWESSGVWKRTRFDSELSYYTGQAPNQMWDLVHRLL